MTHNNVIFCLIAFILGWLISRMMGNGFSVGGQNKKENNINLWEDAVDCSYQQVGILTRGIKNINNIIKIIINVFNTKLNCKYLCL